MGKAIRYIAVYLGLTFWVLGSCEGPKPENRYQKIAAGFCECTTQLVALNKAAITMAADTSANTKVLYQQMEAEYNKSRECCAYLIAQYGKLQKEDFVEIEKVLSEKCPDYDLQKDLFREILGL
ncbi:MAG: hypothetical protein KGS48_03060 [Bacteroidetes bacterium]|nr:hypothetical protein [Bacteroidota bacterium]